MTTSRATVRAVPIRERLRLAEEKAVELQKDNDALRDATNAILEQAGGAINVSMEHVLRAGRKRISVLAMGDHIVITTDPARMLGPRPGLRDLARAIRAIRAMRP